MPPEPGSHPPDEPQARARSRVATTIDGKWHLDALLGTGGMAAVYAATHRNGTRAAVKILNPEIALHQASKARFLREGYVANKIGHPSVVQVLDDDEAPDGTAYLVMELLDGEALQDVVAAGRKLPEVEVLRIAYEVLDILEVAHAKEIIHRDLKPGNLLRTRTGSIKLLDFGIAKVRESTAGAGPHVTTLATVGTPGFMPPEQARGRMDSVDGRADVWALGATMFVLLTGRYVHEEETASEQLLAAMTKPAPPIAEVSPGTSAAIAAIVDAALAFDREQRFSGAATMKAAVVEALRALGEEAPALVPAPAATPSVVIRSTTAATVSDSAATIAKPASVAITDGAASVDVPPRPAGRRWLGLAALVAAAAVVAIAIVRGGPGTSREIPTATAATTGAVVAAPSISAPTPATPTARASASAAPHGSSETDAAASAVTPGGRARVAAPASAPSASGTAPAPAASSAPPASSVDIFRRRH